MATTETQRPSVRRSTSVLRMALAVSPNTPSSARTGPFSTSSTSSVTGGSTWTAPLQLTSTPSMRRLLLREKPTLLLEEEMDMLVVVEVVQVVLVEEATVKEGVAVVVKGVAAHQEALHQGLLEGKALTRVAHLAVVQVDQLVQEGQEEGQAGEVLQVEDEEEAQVGDLAGGKVPAIVEPPLQVNQAMDQPAVEEETLETTPSETTTALLLGRSSLVTGPLVVTEVSLH